MSLPLLSALPDALEPILSTLFEPSPSLRTVLVPAVRARLAQGPPPHTYAALIDTCAAVVDGWGYGEKADFVGGHPMIGEVGGLSALSTKEQASVATRPVVLERLAHLNALYCAAYPGLRFVTFVNGRPRSAIVNEMEHTLGIPTSPDPLPDSYPVREPALGSGEAAALRRDPREGAAERAAWTAECDRAVADVWRIAKARVRGMGLE